MNEWYLIIACDDGPPLFSWWLTYTGSPYVYWVPPPPPNAGTLFLFGDTSGTHHGLVWPPEPTWTLPRPTSDSLHSPVLDCSSEIAAVPKIPNTTKQFLLNAAYKWNRCWDAYLVVFPHFIRKLVHLVKRISILDVRVWDRTNLKAMQNREDLRWENNVWSLLFLSAGTSCRNSVSRGADKICAAGVAASSRAQRDHPG